MLDTYIKNRGATKTILHNQNKNDVNEIKWDADYDGKVANIELDINTNGQSGHYDISLDNQNLADILNIPSVKGSIHHRLLKDFKKTRKTRKNLIQFISPARPEEQYFQLLEPRVLSKEQSLPSFSPTPTLEQTIDSYDDLDGIRIPDTFHTHFSSPKINEELLIPLTIKGKKDRRYTAHKNRKRTHRVYKIVKSSSPKKRSKRKSTSKKFTFFAGS